MKIIPKIWDIERELTKSREAKNKEETEKARAEAEGLRKARKVQFINSHQAAIPDQLPEDVRKFLMALIYYQADNEHKQHIDLMEFIDSINTTHEDLDVDVLARDYAVRLWPQFNEFIESVIEVKAKVDDNPSMAFFPIWMYVKKHLLEEFTIEKRGGTEAYPTERILEIEGLKYLYVHGENRIHLLDSQEDQDTQDISVIL